MGSAICPQRRICEQARPRTARFAFTLKYASYDADALGGDTDKYWLSLDYSF